MLSLVLLGGLVAGRCVYWSGFRLQVWLLIIIFRSEFCTSGSNWRNASNSRRGTSPKDMKFKGLPIIPFIQVHLGGTVSYAPQVPWIRNASVRENVLFGQPDDEDRFVAFWSCVLIFETNRRSLFHSDSERLFVHAAWTTTSRFFLMEKILKLERRVLTWVVCFYIKSCGFVCLI